MSLRGEGEWTIVYGWCVKTQAVVATGNEILF